MEKLVDDGIARSIGVSNFSLRQLDEILKVARIQPLHNQVELNPYLPQVGMGALLLSSTVTRLPYDCAEIPASCASKEDLNEVMLILHLEPVLRATAEILGGVSQERPGRNSFGVKK
eukprot:1138230-Pelagomonas_calceolata.AAC.3